MLPVLLVAQETIATSFDALYQELDRQKALVGAFTVTRQCPRCVLSYRFTLDETYQERDINLALFLT